VIEGEAERIARIARVDVRMAPKVDSLPVNDKTRKSFIAGSWIGRAGDRYVLTPQVGEKFPGEEYRADG
jgi:hypothetical protein